MSCSAVALGGVVLAATAGYPTTTKTAATGAHRAFSILWFAFTVAPIVAGVDKFFNFLTNWEQYLSPMVTRYVNAGLFMRGVGCVEVIAGLIVAFSPRVGGYIVALWLLGIIANLVSMQQFYDIALRDFGLFLGAIALAQIAQYYKTHTAAS